MLYGRLTGLILSLFWPGFYRHVARNWGGIGLLYVLLLLTVTWIPVLVTWHLAAQRIAREEFPKIAKKLPDVSIKNGKVSSPVPQPLEIKDETGRLVFVLDTTGKIKNLDQTPADLLITETKFHQRDPNTGQIQIHDLSQFPDFDFTRDWVQSWVDTIFTWFALAMFPIVMFLSFIRALILMLLVSIPGLIFNSIFGARVTYGGLLRFAAVGMTLSVYIDTAAMLTGFHIPFYFLVALVLTTVYVAFGCAVSIPPKVEIDYDRDRDDWRDDRPAPVPPVDEGSFKAGDGGIRP